MAPARHRSHKINQFCGILTRPPPFLCWQSTPLPHDTHRGLKNGFKVDCHGSYPSAIQQKPPMLAVLPREGPHLPSKMRAITISFAAQNRSMARSNPSKSLYGSAAASAYRGPLRAILPEQEQGQTTQRNTSEYSVFYVFLLHTSASSSKLQGKYPIFCGGLKQHFSIGTPLLSVFVGYSHLWGPPGRFDARPAHPPPPLPQTGARRAVGSAGLRAQLILPLVGHLS